jgi:uncharacterized protein YkwD
MTPRWRPLAVVLLASACGTAPPHDPQAGVAAGTAPEPKAAEVPRPQGPMTREQAERYAASLVERDRASKGLSKLRWDETAARAGRRHARDLSAHGFTTHVGTDGSVPEQRYTEEGGQAMVFENVGCFSDGKVRAVDPDATFSAESLEKIEQAFMSEVPPADGHRRNILAPHHVAVGIGLAQPHGLDIPCLVQELVDDYGEYQPLPKTARLGQAIVVKGTVRTPASIAGVGLSRIDLPRPRKSEDLRKLHGYAIPPPYQMFWPAGYKTPIVLAVDGDKRGFSIEVPLEKRPGLFGVSVWATFPDAKEPEMVSLRTIEVR